MKNLLHRKKANHTKHTFLKRCVSIVAAATMSMTSTPLGELTPVFNELSAMVAHAVNEPRRAVLSYNDLTDFAAYSLEYSASPDDCCEDIITLNLNQNAVNIFPSNFISLGTEEYPFNGKIYINQTYGNSWWFETDKPIFDYVADSAVINYSDSDHNTQPIQIELRRKEKSDISPLFANHVTEGDSNKATWKIKSALQTQDTGDGTNILVCNTSGLIGDIQENASVTIEYDNSAYDTDTGYRSDVQSVESGGDVGLICQTMYENSQINLTLSGTNNGCLISSTEGHAGGLVGRMNAGSKLLLNSTYLPDSNRSITTKDGYAGGLVGYCDGGKVEFPEPEEGSAAVCTQIRGTIEGTDGAGGLYGYYSNYMEDDTAQSVTIKMENYDVNCTVKAVAAGGLIGVLNGTADFIVDGSGGGSNAITVSGGTVTNFGGIAGTYQASALTNKFEVNTVTANTSATFTETSYYGGVCGQIDDENAAYIKVNGLTHRSSSGFAGATAFGGVVGNAGTAGSMLDVGTVTIETGVTTEGENAAPNGTAFNGGGIVGVLTDGVLRLSGTTNMQKAPANVGRTNGQLVGIRKDSLVYAVGSGNLSENDDENGNENTGDNGDVNDGGDDNENAGDNGNVNGNDSSWIFKRSNINVQTDDIGTWGSVIRADETNLLVAVLESKDAANTGILDFDTTNHTVTVAAPVTTMTSTEDYTRTALNMQLNSGDKGALKFSDSTNTKSVLLSTALSFTGTVDLSGTGNIGLMRDDYKDALTEIGEYTNTISGGTVKLAIGERYGVYTGSSTVGKGDIVAHRYNGLLAGTDTNATISGITVDGTLNVNATVDGTNVGGAVAMAKKGITLTNVTTQEKINFNVIGGSGHIVGGMAAGVSGGNTSISGGTANPEIVLTGNVSSIPVGGAVGKISNAGKTITANGITVATNIDASGATATDLAGAGFIADISGGSMTLTGVTVSGTKLKNAASSHSGGFLGMQWLGTDVSFTANNGVIVSGTENELDTTASYAAGLVQYATGHWVVPEKGIQISGMTIKTAANSLGLLVHDGYSGTNGLYLELTHKDSYDLASTGITVPATTYYDELVRSTSSDILSNGSNGIISITTDGDFIMDGTNCNTYQNKYNKSNVSNSKSRYYYNLTGICAKATKSDGEKLLLWSLNKYAATNINSKFSDAYGTSALTGTFDLEHISYYPIDCPDNLTIGDATFTFYNDKIEASETGTGNSDSSNRTTRSASQHYLMHSGVFRNVPKAITTNGNIHFKGCIGADSNYSGALINGTLSGSLTTNSSKEIVFEGLTLSDPSKYLFINNMTTNSKLTLSGVRTGGGKDFSNADRSSTETGYAAGATVASSLIGDVTGTGIQISFERMKLDSRDTVNSPADWSAQYGTTKSIFSGATFLNRFAVDNNSTGTYDFEEALDWTGGVHNANVTYGIEIKTSVEYAGKQEKYYDQNNFVDPIAAPSSARTAVYGFDSGFLPYVKQSTAILDNSVPPKSKYTTRELKVNVRIQGLKVGCGTYNHPYEITTGSQLTNVATAINKTSYPDSLRLPKEQGSNYAAVIGTHWCETKNTSCAEFTHDKDNKNFNYTEGSTKYTWTEDQVSLYLASAYYIVKNSITIEGSYPGLGSSPASDTTGKYAFRGVIVGASSDGSITITNKTGQDKTNNNDNFHNTFGLITMSNGCVVKNLTIKVDFPDSDKYQYRSNGNQAYGYDEKFPNYGAVINKIMGGDNIIDNVTVQFEDTFKVLSDSSYYKATVGGYVGCVVNGGLIFRNVDDSKLKRTVVNGENKTTVQGFKVISVNSSGTQQQVKIGNNVICSSTVEGSMTDADDLIHIHVNPFVGRVINGYAIHETTDDLSTENVNEARYAFSEDGATYGDGETRANAVEVTMHNTRKNYSIPDIDTSNPNGVLSFSQSASGGTYDTISVPDSQALYIMSIIAQSGSGCASSETEEYAYNISYCGDSDNRTYAGTEKNNNKATHLAHYSDVGTATSTADADYILSMKDTVNVNTAVPYIIYKYTSSYGSTPSYPARTLTKRTFFVNLIAGTTYYLPDCFRGIGFLGSNTLDDNMKIYGFNGNGTTENPTIIDVNEEYFVNKAEIDPYTNLNLGSNLKTYQTGIGIFNNLKQSSSTGFNGNYESDSKYQITNFTLQGFVSAHNVSTSGVDENAPHSETGRSDTVMRTAGFIANIQSSDVKLLNFSNISFSNIHINSYSFAGGFIGIAQEVYPMIYINNCNADGYKIEGCGRVAGFVASYDIKGGFGGLHINTGNSTDASIIKNTIINNRFNIDSKMNYSAGVVGCVYSNQSKLIESTTDNAKGELIIRNVTIEGGNAETNYIGNKNAPSGSSGGIVGGGTAKLFGCLIQNCTVKNIDIYGRYAGGIFGENANRRSSASKMGAKIYGCTVTGELDDGGNPQYSIMALQYSGGVYGDTRDSQTNVYPVYNNVEYKTDIDGVYVYGYNIYSINKEKTDTAEDSYYNSSNVSPKGIGAGGITGNNDYDRYIQNCKIEKCVIDVGTGENTANNTPCGGFIGRIGVKAANDSTSTGTIYGYNIEIKNCDFYTHQWVKASTANGVITPAHATNTKPAYETDTNTPVSGMKCGNVIGNGNGCEVDITAIHVEGCPAADFNSVSSSSFNVYADYNDVASSDEHGDTMSDLCVLSSGYSNVSEGGLTEYFPHVNVSPVIHMGTDTILTGDGAALYSKTVTGLNSNGESVTSNVNTPVIDAIVNDKDSNYLTPSSATKTYIQHALQSTSYTGEPNKISTYKTEMGTLPDGVDDFTVLVINSENRNYSTEFINNYIQMISNTNHNFDTVSGNNKTLNKTDNYEVKVYPCTYDEQEGKYVINASGKSAGLECDHANSGQNTKYVYFMRNTHADSNQGDYQFSLMDIQFYNPNTSLKEIAYHLYIPVLTKKMLMFDFYSASQSGTDNKAVNFDNFGNTLAESLDSWYTGYLQFTYNQTELQSILESGAGLNWNGAKTILLKYQTDTVAAKLGANTQLVLCDPNNSDKYYYATLGSMRPTPDTDGEADTISFAKFKTKTDGTGDSFTAVTLNDMLLAQGFKITAQTAAAGTVDYIYAPTTNKSEADVIVSNSEMYKKVDTGGTVKLTISYPKKDNPDENDDSKVLVENYYLAVRANGNSVYNYSIRTPATTSGGADKPTLRRSNAEEGNVTNVIMGSLYKQTVIIDVKNNDKTSEIINAEDHRLDVTLNSMIELKGSNTDKDYILGHLTNENIHLYQAFIVNLTAHELINRSDILGTPTITTNFDIVGNGKNGEDNNVIMDNVAGSYIQLKPHDVKEYLSKDGITKITAVSHIEFAEEWQYDAEFPKQDGSQSQIGVNVSAKSNLSYNESKMRFTNMTMNPTTPSNRYFYIRESDKASLVYNMKSEILDEYDKAGAPSFNYSQQGINPRNFIDGTQTLLPIQTAATYNATKVKRTDFMNAEKVKYTLKLYKKTDIHNNENNNDEVRYVEVDKIVDYIEEDSVYITINSGVESDYLTRTPMLKSGDNELTYTANVDQSAFKKQDDQRIVADIDFNVITGDGFTDYANYRLLLSVDLLKTENNEEVQITLNSNAHDWVVYTNAKINPDMLSISEYNGS